MKKLISLLLILLLALNGFLFYRIDTLEKRLETGTNSSGGTIINKYISEFETDVTKVVDDVYDKTVSVVQYRRNNLTGSGTGVVYEVEKQGMYVITNHHVIENAEEIRLRLADGEEHDATLVGSDMYSDLALLFIKGEFDIEPFKIGDSSKITVGEFVVAMGSPLGVEFSNSSTFGIISGKDRIVPVDLNNDGVADWDMVVIQTDAAINPGNSGGALVNMASELIGINSLKISSEKIEGMGFSIPINEVVPIIEQIKLTGKVQYPVIGISAIALNEIGLGHLAQLNLPQGTKGVLVIDVSLGGPAYFAGIKKNDVITKFDNVDVSDFKAFRKQLYLKKPKDVIKLEILRDEEIEIVEVTLE